MQATNWAPVHSDALRECLAKGMSYSQAARAINAEFGTDYTRNAAIGRGQRMGLAGPKTRKEPKRVPRAASAPTLGARRRAKTVKPRPVRPSPVFGPTEPVKLRCVGIEPRLLCLVDLEAGDCRYPYGGDKDGEAIAFCGHPRRAGSSYCTPHFDLTRGPDTVSERAAGPVMLRLVEAA